MTFLLKELFLLSAAYFNRVKVQNKGKNSTSLVAECVFHFCIVDGVRDIDVSKRKSKDMILFYVTGYFKAKTCVKRLYVI